MVSTIFLIQVTEERIAEIRRELCENFTVIRVVYSLKDSADYNAVEECWRQGKDDLLVSKYYPKFPNLKSAVAISF